MNSRQALKAGINSGQGVVDAYLEDLSDADLLVRPMPGTNHIAWQLGHLIAAEHMMVDAVRPKSMPPLPPGFAEKHDRKTDKSDNPKDFCSKAEYLDLLKKQRAGTFAVLDTLNDADLDKEAPEAVRDFVKTVGAVFAMQGTHWLMHAGQWAIIRRKLGRKPLF